MRNCDTLIIGSGYTSLGYAFSRPDTLIVEERELCDVSFCFAQRGYGAVDVQESGLASELYGYYRERGLVRDGLLNVGALEMGMCAFMQERGIKALLKCRVISVRALEDGCFEARVISGGGLEHIRARRVLDMRSRGERATLTLLFTADDTAAVSAVSSAFPEGTVTPAFYEGRYALTLPVCGEYNEEKRRITDRWRAAEHEARLLYIAPALAVRSESSNGVPCDSGFDSPFDAFAAGAKYALEVE